MIQKTNELGIILQSRTFAYFIISLIIILIYGSFINYYFTSDDFGILYRAKYLSIYDEFIGQFFQSFFYRPITQGIFFRIYFTLFKLNPIGYRCFIIFLFILNTILLYEITLFITRDRYVALIAAIIFLSRKAHVTAIAWIAAGFEQQGTILFMLLTIFLYLYYKNKGNIIFYVISLLAFFFAILSKESSVTIPLLLISYDLIIKEQIKWPAFKKSLINKIPFILLTGIPVSRFVLRDIIKSSSFAATGGFYSMILSPTLIINNFIYYFCKSFNTTFEMVIFIPILLIVFLKKYYCKPILFMAVLFILGVSPYVFLRIENLWLFYLCFSLTGAAVIMAIGIKSALDYFPFEKHSLLFLLIIILFVLSLANGAKNSKEMGEFEELELISRSAFFYLQKQFPSLPDNSLLYIRGADMEFSWAMGNGKAFKLLYNNNLAFYFEGLTKIKPAFAAFTNIYILSCVRNKIYFTKKISGEDFKRYLN
jgi:hypothetical protein